MAHKISFAIDLITSKWPKITPKTIYTKMAQGEGAILILSQGGKNNWKMAQLCHLNFETLCAIYLLFPTSSTAQGGGGSFKNRKRIGEIDCCE